VKSYLVSQGISAERIRTRGAGPDEPLIREKNRPARQKNRRIEFHVVQ
jgi:adhesin transport system outer membrane protein